MLCILIYANKQDLAGAKKVNDIVLIYELDSITNHIWHIQPCSAQTREELITGKKLLSNQLLLKSNNSFPVNPYTDFLENKKTNKKTVVNKSMNNTNND